MRTGMPLHRGPHRRYNEMVIERVGQIENEWSRIYCQDEERACDEVRWRLELLQRALRLRLLTERRRFLLNRKDPIGHGFDFFELDAMAEKLWNA